MLRSKTNQGFLAHVLDTPTFTMVFDHAILPATLFHGAVRVSDSSYNVVSGATLNFSLSADQKTLTIVVNGLSPATTYLLHLGYYATLLDISGNGAYFGNADYRFTTQ